MTMIMIVLLAFFTLGGLYFYMASQSEYGIVVSQDFKDVYTNTTELSGFLEDTTGIGINMTDEALTAKQLEDSFIDPSASQIKTTKLIWDSFDIVKGMILGIGKALHIPPILVGVGIALLSFGLIFAFLSMIFRWDT